MGSNQLEAISGGGFKKALALAIYTELRKEMSPGDHMREKLMRVASVFRSFQIKADPTGNYTFGFEVAPAAGVADSGEFERDVLELLTELGGAARELDMGVLLAIDELQDAPKGDINGLNVAIHTLGKVAWPTSQAPGKPNVNVRTLSHGPFCILIPRLVKV